MRKIVVVGLVLILMAVAGCAEEEESGIGSQESQARANEMLTALRQFKSSWLAGGITSVPQTVTGTVVRTCGENAAYVAEHPSEFAASQMKKACEDFTRAMEKGTVGDESATLDALNSAIDRLE